MIMIILDTSIAVKWFFSDEQGHAKAKEVLDGLVHKPDDFSVPSLFFFELTAVLTRKSQFQKEFVETSLDAVYQLGIPSLDIGQELAKQAIAISCRYHVTYYDAVFLAVAKNLRGIWLTTDQRALKRIPKAMAMHLSDFDSP